MNNMLMNNIFCVLFLLLLSFDGCIVSHETNFTDASDDIPLIFKLESRDNLIIVNIINNTNKDLLLEIPSELEYQITLTNAQDGVDYLSNGYPINPYDSLFKIIKGRNNLYDSDCSSDSMYMTSISINKVTVSQILELSIILRYAYISELKNINDIQDLKKESRKYHYKIDNPFKRN